jgi:phage gp36-like protein
LPYVLQSDIAGDIPAPFLIEALDDDGDGLADDGVWDAVAASVATEIDGVLGQRFPVPFVTVPAVVKAAAQILALSKLYTRRGFSGDKNPWDEQAEAVRTKLNAIADGDQPLQPGAKRPASGVIAVTEPSKASSACGHLPA